MTDPDRSVLKVRRSILIHAPADRVWRAFSDANRLRSWWTGVQSFEPKAGGRIELAMAVDGEAAVLGGTIAIFAHLRDLTFEADFVPARDWAAPSWMTVRLISALKGTLVELLHHGFEATGGDVAATHASFERSWGMAELTALKTVIETG